MAENIERLRIALLFIGFLLLLLLSAMTAFSEFVLRTGLANRCEAIHLFDEQFRENADDCTLANFDIGIN